LLQNNIDCILKRTVYETPVNFEVSNFQHFIFFIYWGGGAFTYFLSTFFLRDVGLSNLPLHDWKELALGEFFRMKYSVNILVAHDTN
jgi:hypothetical protein